MCPENKARLYRTIWMFFERKRMMANGVLAEREGFEPPIRLPVCRISSAVLSTAQPPLRNNEAHERRGAVFSGGWRAKQGRLGSAPCLRKGSKISEFGT